LRRQPQNLENVTLVARPRKQSRAFLANLFVAELPQKKRYFNTQKSTRFLSTGVEKKREKKKIQKVFPLQKKKKEEEAENQRLFKKCVLFKKQKIG